MEIKVDALVLRTADYGESDRMLTLFTLQRGKLSAACKGVRKAGAKLRFAAQPFCFAEYVLAVRGERATVISAANTDGFYGLRSSVEKLYAAASLAAVCDALLFDGIVNEALFLYAVDALRSMCEGNEAEILISFLWRALDLSGYRFDLCRCAGCGAPVEGRAYFDVAGGGFYCAECARGAGVSEGTLQLLRKCAGMSYRAEAIAPDSARRALKLLYTGFRARTEADAKALGEYIDIL